MSFENQYTALSRATDIRHIHIDNTWSYFYSDYDEKHNRIPLVQLDTNEIYDIYCSITEQCYAGKTKGGVAIRNSEHMNDPKCVVNRLMKKPEIKLLGVYVCGPKKILEIENNWIRHYRKLYGSNCINITGGESDDANLFEFEAIKVIEEINLPRLYKEHDRLRLMWCDNDGQKKMKSCKSKKSFDKALDTMMKFINLNLMVNLFVLVIGDFNETLNKLFRIFINLIID